MTIEGYKTPLYTLSQLNTEGKKNIFISLLSWTVCSSFFNFRPLTAQRVAINWEIYFHRIFVLNIFCVLSSDEAYNPTICLCLTVTYCIGNNEFINWLTKYVNYIQSSIWKTLTTRRRKKMASVNGCYWFWIPITMENLLSFYCPVGVVFGCECLK